MMNYHHNPIFLIGNSSIGKDLSRDEVIHSQITGFKVERNLFNKTPFSNLAHILFNRLFVYDNEDESDNVNFEISFLEFVDYLKDYKNYSGPEPYYHNPSTFVVHTNETVFNKKKENYTVDDLIKEFIGWELSHGQELNEDTFSDVVHEIFNNIQNFHTYEEAVKSMKKYKNSEVWCIEFLDVVRHLREYMLSEKLLKSDK